nr:protein kinase-like domain-containing protein [Tanacetum cinerariifolium]
MMKKLKMLKDKIRGWTNIYKEGMKCGKRTLKAELDINNTKIDRGEGDDSDTNRRLEIIWLIQDIDKARSSTPQDGRTPVSIATVVVTKGYAAPEYVQMGPLSAKINSILKELITGRRPLAQKPHLEQT